MKNNNMLTDARYIFATGRLIHDNIHRIIAAAGMEKGKNAPFGKLSYQQKNMIMLIHGQESVSVTELAGMLNVSPPSVSAMVERLVERGLLTRTPCEKDRRRVEIRVASEALEQIAFVERKIQESFEGLVEELGPETTSQWCQVLEQVKRIMDENRWPSKSHLENPV